MSAEGRIISLLGKQSCEINPDIIHCRLLSGDLMWFTLTIFILFMGWGLSFTVRALIQEGRETGKFKRLLNKRAFWKWYKKRENFFPTTGISLFGGLFVAIHFVTYLIGVLVIALMFYLYKNWDSKDK
jgi:hypothetical protein